jgi:F0F1-type ATP synthase assembly protein I
VRIVLSVCSPGHVLAFLIGYVSVFLPFFSSVPLIVRSCEKQKKKKKSVEVKMKKKRKEKTKKVLK